MKKLMLIITVLTSSLLALPILVQAQSSSTGAGLRIAPTFTELSAAPGETKTVQVTISNITSNSELVSGSFADFTYGTSGEPILLSDDGKSEFGMSDWSYAVQDFEISPLGELDIDVTFTVPTDAVNQTYYTTALFTSNTGSELAAGIGSLIFVNVGAPSYQGLVESYSLLQPRTGASAMQAEVKVNNTGQYKFTPSFSIDLTDSKGLVIENIQPDKKGSVLPGQTRTFTFDFATVPTEGETYAIAPVATVDGVILENESVAAQSQEIQSEPESNPEVVATTADQLPTPEAELSSLVVVIIIAAVSAVLVSAVAIVLVMKKKSKNESVAAQQVSAPAHAVTSSFEPPQTIVPTAQQVPQDQPVAPREPSPDFASQQPEPPAATSNSSFPQDPQ